MIFSAVLRRSLAFGPEHVEWLGRQIARHYPDAEFLPFSDTPLSIGHIRLVDGFPAWWSKMEAMRHLTEDTVVMLDLDTVILRPIDIPVPPNGFAYMQSSPRDFDKVWGGLQISSPEFRKVVSDHFYENPNRAIEDSLGCDQKLYRALWRDRIKLLNVERPDAVVSYKLHYLQQGLMPENAFIAFHGLPRPWHVVEPWIPPLFPSE
jgi:hypothetical protein